MKQEKTTDFLILTSDLAVGYRKECPLIQGLNLCIQTASMIALLGPNGSGKTTLIRTLTGLIPPLDGKVFRNSSVRFSLVPQMKTIRLEFPMTVYDSLNLSLGRGGAILRRWNPDSEEAEILERTGTNRFLNLLLRECSGGQLQRFLIARALLSKSNLVFLDEPIDALDSDSQIEILHLLKDMQERRRMSFFLITHNLVAVWRSALDEILRIEDRSLIFERGIE